MMDTNDEWLALLEHLIDQHIEDPNLSNFRLSRMVAMSERHFIRKVKSLTGLPPQKFVRRHRLRVAKELLESGSFQTVKEVALAVSYQSSSYFITQFELEFGLRPLQVLKNAGWR